MKEQQFFHSQRSVAAQPPAPNPSHIGIQINWGKAVAETIEIRHRHLEIASLGCGINLKPGCPQAHGAQLALDAQAPMIFASRTGRRAT
jgi:hypothetical protein